MANLPVDQLFRNQYITGSYSQIAAPAAPFEDVYKLGPSGPAERTPTGYFSTDIFNNTRLMAKLRAPKAGPATENVRPYGQFTGTLMRSHSKVPLLDNDIAQYRPRGGQVGTLDASGQKYVADQVRSHLQKMRNLRHWTLRSTLTGGFGVKTDGEDMIVVAKGSGDYDIDSKIPSTNIGTVESIFASDSWDTSTTDITSQFLALNAHAERLSGLPPAIAWINSNTYSRMINNTIIRSQVGTAYRIFDVQTGREVATIPDGRRQSGWAVRFTVIPQILFIVCDAVVQLDQVVDSTAAADSTKFIPDGKMIVTPAPSSDWLGQVIGGEWVREHKADLSPQWHWGFYNWIEPTTQPAGRELIFVDWWLHYLKIPTAVYYIDVWNP